MLDTTVLQQNLESAIESYLKAESYISKNFEKLFTLYLEGLKEKFNCLRHLSLVFSSDYCEDHDSYFTPYLSSATIDIDSNQFENPALYEEKMGNKDFYQSAYSFPNLHLMSFFPGNSTHNSMNKIVNEDLRNALQELNQMVNSPIIFKSSSLYYEYDNFMLIYNFDNKHMTFSSI